MLDFYAHLWFWLVACLTVGAATGLLVRAPLRERPARWLIWTALAFVAGAVALALGAIEGAAALHVESALAFFAAFLVGAAAAAYAERRTLAAHEGWAVGLLPVALLWWGATLSTQPDYQAELLARAASLAREAGVDPAGLGLSGRDVTASPAVAADRALLARLAAAPGVRRVVLAREAAPSAAGEKTAGAPAPAQRPPGATPPSGPSPATPAHSVEAPSPEAPPPAPEPATDRAEAPAALAEGDLDAASCQRALDAVTAREPVVFRARRSLVTRRVAEALDKAAEVIRRCPDDTIEVLGFGDADDRNALAERRARAAERYLRHEGVGGRRLVPLAASAEQRRGAGAIAFQLR